MPIYSPGHVVTADEFNAMMPVGTVLPFAGSAAPVGWLPCDGAAVSRTTYSDLFSVIGTTYGAGDGSTTFNVPDTRGRAIVHKAGSGTFQTLGSTGGAETHALSAAEAGAEHVHAISITSGNDSADHTHSGTTASNNASHTHAGAAHTHSTPAHSHTISGVISSGAGPTDDGINILTFAHVTTGVIGSGGSDGAGTSGGASATTTGTQSANHTHTVTTGGRSANHTHSVSGNTTAGTAATAHTNLQPYMVLLGIIRY